ncbi:putative formin-like protein 5 [Iris pallida]|uniref:Formin-like protein 5 n=1 Tax=Iris pallida TaxID=29817 RepID=A0AAX6FUI1_IRIPA|nr:putative formin-like protein 5 [Iris pallida]
MNTAQYREKSEKAKASRQGWSAYGRFKAPRSDACRFGTTGGKGGEETESVTAYDVFLHTHKRRADGSFDAAGPGD